MKCKDYNKDIFQDKDGQESIDLYHATIDTEGVCKNGLKIPKNSPYCSLGCGYQTKRLISFTKDKKNAENIARDIQTKVMIARGDITTQNICSILNQRDWKKDQIKTPCEIWKNTFKKCHYKNCKTPNGQNEQWNATTERWEKLEMLKEGFVSFNANGFLLEYLKENWDTKKGWIPSAYYKNKPNNSKVYSVFHEGNKTSIQKTLFNLWRKNYLHNRENFKGFANPVIETDPNLYKLKNVDPCKVGIVKVKGHIPTKEFLKDMSKYVREDYWEKLGYQNDQYVDKFNKEIRLSPNRFDHLEIISKLTKNCKI